MQKSKNIYQTVFEKLAIWVKMAQNYTKWPIKLAQVIQSKKKKYHFEIFS